MKRLWLGFLVGTLGIAAISLLTVRCGTRGEEAPDAGRRDAGTPKDGGADAGAAEDAGVADAGTFTDTTILMIRQGNVTAPTCVRVTGVVMSGLFDDQDNKALSDGGSSPKKGFYLSEKGLSTTAPRTGILVNINPDVAPVTVAVGDDVTIGGDYRENFNQSLIQMSSFCNSFTRNATGAATPTPAAVTIAEVGQAGTCTGDAGCVDGVKAEDFEGVLVTIAAGMVTACGRTFSTDPFGQFEVGDGTNRLQISRHFGLTASPSVSEVVQSITGFGHYSFGRRKLRPRNNGEVVIQSTVPDCGNAAKADHLLLTEVKIGPTGSEFIEIHNPTAAAVDLSNHYLWNATFTPSDGGVPCRYFDTPSTLAANDGGLGTCGTGFGDFALQFPQGASIGPGEFQVVAVNGALNYCSGLYPDDTCAKPDYEIPPPASGDSTVPDMRGNFDTNMCGFCTISCVACTSGTGFLTSGSEDMVLFRYDPPTDGGVGLVQDVDYLVWGTSTGVRTDKSGAGYQDDTAPSAQNAPAGSIGVSSYQRYCMNEGTEATTGGDGTTGHKELSENLATTWAIRCEHTARAATPGATP